MQTVGDLTQPVVKVRFLTGAFSLPIGGSSFMTPRSSSCHGVDQKGVVLVDRMLMLCIFYSRIAIVMKGNGKHV